MRIIRLLMHQSRGTLLLAVGVGIVGGVATTLLLAVLNRAVHGGGAAAGPRMGWAFLGLALLVLGSRLGSLYLLQHLGQGSVVRLRLDLAGRILRAPLARLEALGPSKLLATLTGDINRIANAVMVFPVVCVNGAIVLACLIYLLLLSRALFLVLLGLIVLGVLLYQLPMLAGMKQLAAARRTLDTLFRHFRSLTDGLKELKMHAARGEAFLSSLHGTAETQRGQQVAANMIFGTAATWGNLLLFLVLGGLVWFAPQPGDDAGRPLLAQYALVLIYLISPLQVLLDSLNPIGQANVALAKVKELGLALPGVGRGEEIGEAAAVEAGSDRDGPSEIRLEGIEYRYQDGDERHRFELGPASLTVRPGELLFVTGGNGSGKTTLAKVLLGLYPPTAGRILVGGEAVEAERLAAYRQRFSAVFADFHLFDQLLGLDHHELDERARRLLERLELAGQVEVAEGRLSTTSLSQGQKKRLALLTAFLEDRPAYVFDEWAADQDPFFKDFFYRELLPELRKRGKIVVVISHDDRYYDVADRVVKLVDGKLAEGTGSAA